MSGIERTIRAIPRAQSGTSKGQTKKKEEERTYVFIHGNDQHEGSTLHKHGQWLPI
jgi:hypothetical protein